MFERYSVRARRVLFFARYESSVLGGTTLEPAIEPAHVLLGLIRESRGVAHLLAHWNISPGELRLGIEQRMNRTNPGTKLSTSVEIPFAEATKRVLNLAAEEADRLLQYHIEPEHLLLALLREDDPVAARSLKAYGMTPDGTREYLATRSVAVEREPETDVMQPANPLVAVHLERITQLVRDLAQAESNSAEGLVLVREIDLELMMLQKLLE